MASGLFFFALQAIILQTAYSQCVNRVVSGCAPNVVETLLPNQYFSPGLLAPTAPIPALAPAAPVPIAAPIMAGAPFIPEVGYPTVIQDSSVANSLANALQLLVVSNLLSSTLPGPCDCGYPVESLMPMPALPMPAYNYVY